MRTVRSFLLCAGALLATLLCAAAAHAQPAPATPTAPPDLGALWPMFGMVIALGWGYLSRKLGTAQGFFQTNWGHGIITLCGAVIGAGLPVIQAYKGGIHGFPWAALAWAALGAGTSFFSALNPSLTYSGASKLPDKLAGAEVRLPPPIRPGMLLPFLLIGALAVQGCAANPCRLPANALSPACRALDIVVTCGAPAIVAGLAGLVTGLVPAITGTAIDWGAIAALEKQYGTAAVACAMQHALVIAGGLAAPADHPDIAPGVYTRLRAARPLVAYNVAAYYAARHIVVVP